MVAGICCLLVAVFAIPAALITANVMGPPLWRNVVMVTASAIPLLAVVPLLALGLTWMVRGTRMRESASAQRAPSFGGLNRTRIAEERARSVQRSMLLRGILYALLSIPTAIWCLVWLLLTIVGVSNTYSMPGLMWLKVGVLFAVGGMVLPFTLTAVLVWRSVVNIRDLLRVRQLVSALSVPGIQTMGDLSQAMDVSQVVTDSTATLALSRGLLDPMSYTLLASPSRHPNGVWRIGDKPESWIGRTLGGRYVVETLIGHGGMGAVFGARDLQSSHGVAIKVLLPEACGSADALQRLRREASIAQSLNHPGIVRVLEFSYAEDGLPYLVMDRLDGETLEARLERTGMVPWPEARKFSLEVGDALATLHEAGLLHRDLKPSNIFLVRDQDNVRPVLIDFGLAKRMSSATPRVTATGQVLGTPLYMSPEQARGEPLDIRSDVFGMAVVVCEMVTGTPPFFDDTLAKVYAKLLNETSLPAIAQSPGYPPGLSSVIATAIALRREDRYPHVRAFVAALSALD